MRLFQNIERYKGYNIYSLKKYVDKKRIIVTVISTIILTIVVGIIIYYTINIKKMLKAKENFENQILEYVSQIEAEKKQEEQAKIPQLTENSKEQIKHIYTSESKRVFLTFDDGPSTNTNDILDILKEKNIKATFFVLGSQVEKMPETTKKIYEEGHYIANHGYSHIYPSLYATPNEVVNEYTKCNELVQNAIQNKEYNTYIFRFPGGSIGGKYAEIKNQAITLLEQNNIVYVDWNALTGDSETKEPTEEYLMNNLQNTTQNKNSVVLLMHDSQNKRITVEFLNKAIEYLEQQGYKFMNFYDIMK